MDAPFPGPEAFGRDRATAGASPARRRGGKSDTYWTRLASRTDRSGGSARQLRRSRRSRRWRRRDGPRADRGGHRAEPRRATGCGDAQRPREVLKKADAVSVRAAEERKRAFRILKREPATTPRHRDAADAAKAAAAAAAREDASLCLSLSLSLYLSLFTSAWIPRSRAPPPPISASAL